MISLLYGQPGTGKSTLATGLILDFLRAGKRVVSNFAVDASPACINPRHKISQGHVEVLPARPSYQQLQDIGLGWVHPEHFGREEFSGLLVLDEVGGWINSRSWSESNRQLIVDWFLHSRKRGWDIIFIAQHPNLIDKQVREAVVEAYARVRRMDRMKVPVVGVSLPRIHIAILRYGLELTAPKLQTWYYRGRVEHKCFASYALFDAAADVVGTYCTLPARITKYGLGVDLKRHRPVLQPKRPLISALQSLPPDRRLRALSLAVDRGYPI